MPIKERKQEYKIKKSIQKHTLIPLVTITWKKKFITLNHEALQDISSEEGELEALNRVISNLRYYNMLPVKNELMFLKRYMELVYLNKWD